MAGTLSEVTDSSFQAEVIEADGPVLVDFWAPCAVPAAWLRRCSKRSQPSGRSCAW